MGGRLSGTVPRNATPSPLRGSPHLRGINRSAFSCRISPRERGVCQVGKYEMLVFCIEKRLPLVPWAGGSFCGKERQRRSRTWHLEKTGPVLRAEALRQQDLIISPFTIVRNKCHGDIQISSQDFSCDGLLFVRKYHILKSFFPLFLEILLSECGQPSWFGCGPLGTDHILGKYPGNVYSLFQN